ncbi:MAG TPA: RNA methyltransferase [Acidimicrobiales bacterium]
MAYRHQRVQRLRRLLQRPATRQAEGAFVIEGAKLLAEALDAGVRVESVYLEPVAEPGSSGLAALADRALADGARVFTLAGDVMARVADTTTPQPVMAVVETVTAGLEELKGAKLVLVLADVRDPGNAGTVVRCAEAAGAEGVVFCRGSVDVYNPKTVRASAGSLFHVRVVVGGGPLDVLDRMGGWGMQRLAAVARTGRAHTEADLTRPTAFLLGNEAGGLDPASVAACDDTISIPMVGRAESLNVGMAAAVLCFEATRQRAQVPHG